MTITKPTESDVYVALMDIVDHKEDKALNYAINYAKAGLHLTGHELKIQCLYILNNITHWRREGHKEVRKVLKDFVK